MMTLPLKDLQFFRGSPALVRLTLIAVGFLALFLVIFVAIDYYVQRGLVIVELEKQSDLFGRAVEGSLQLGMISMRRDLLQGTIERLTDDQAVYRVLLLNMQGRIAASSDVRAIDTFIPLDSPGCRACHTRRATPTKRIALIRDPDGHHYYRSVRPIRNRPACQACHNPKQVNNGILIIDYDQEFLTAQVQDAWQRVTRDTVLFALAGLPLLVVALSLTLRRYFIRPMRKLEYLTHDIATGAFPKEIKPELRGDVAQLGNALIEMSQRLEASFEDLKSARDYMNTLVDSIEDGLVVINSDYRISNINRSALALTGRGYHDVVLGPCKEVCFCEGRTEECPTSRVFREKQTCRVEFRVQRDDGRPRWFEVNASPLIDGRGEVVEVVEVIRDITFRRELEQKLMHSDRLSAMGRLAASVAHELNTPLGTIMTCGEGLLRDRDRSPEMRVTDWEDLQPYLSTMLSAVKRGRKVVQELLVYVHRSELSQRDPVDVNGIIADAMGMIRYEPNAGYVQFSLNLGDGLPPVIGDATQLTQVAFNLIQNSLDAVERQGTVIVTSAFQDDEVCITVEDDGAGIPAEYQARIFEPFFTTKEIGLGTGLGLYMCREIVHQHGGRITWQSSAKGTLFGVRLPAAEARSDA